MKILLLFTWSKRITWYEEIILKIKLLGFISLTDFMQEFIELINSLIYASAWKKSFYMFLHSCGFQDKSFNLFL